MRDDERSVVFRAAEAAAAAGHYAVADFLVKGTTADAVADHLRARIAAQQGRYADAARLWSGVIEVYPDHREAHDGLRLARRLEHAGSATRLLANRFYAAGLIAVAVVTVSFGARWLPDRRVGHAARVTTGPTSEAVAPNLPSASPVVAPARRRLGLFQLDGVTQEEGQSGVAIAFVEGVFARNLRIRPPARAALASLGRQLRQLSAAPSVTVTGYADDLPMPPGRRFHDNAALALARAVVVVDALRTESGLPSSAFVASGTDGPPGVPSSHVPTTRHQNRTVRIVVTAAR